MSYTATRHGLIYETRFGGDWVDVDRIVEYVRALMGTADRQSVLADLKGMADYGMATMNGNRSARYEGVVLQTPRGHKYALVTPERYTIADLELDDQGHARLPDAEHELERIIAPEWKGLRL
jgi:hypothetical protein